MKQCQLWGTIGSLCGHWLDLACHHSPQRSRALVVERNCVSNEAGNAPVTGCAEGNELESKQKGATNVAPRVSLLF